MLKMNFNDAKDELMGITETSWHEKLVDDVIRNLREEYEPTIVMSGDQYDALKQYLYGDMGTFYMLLDDSIYTTEINKLFSDFSEEDLMQAWLHPESIVVERTEKHTDLIESSSDNDKWIVRSNFTSAFHKWLVLSSASRDNIVPMYTDVYSLALVFDTEEEAKKWEVISTKAVKTKIKNGLPTQGEDK